MIGWKFSRHFFNQSEVKPKPIVARAGTFSRALCRLHVITSSFDWFTGLCPSFLIGQSNFFGFGFTTLIWKPPYLHVPIIIIITIITSWPATWFSSSGQPQRKKYWNPIESLPCNGILINIKEKIRKKPRKCLLISLQPRKCYRTLVSINYLITESEVVTAKSLTEALPYWPSDREVNTARPWAVRENNALELSCS